MSIVGQFDQNLKDLAKLNKYKYFFLEVTQLLARVKEKIFIILWCSKVFS